MESVPVDSAFLEQPWFDSNLCQWKLRLIQTIDQTDNNNSKGNFNSVHLLHKVEHPERFTITHTHTHTHTPHPPPHTHTHARARARARNFLYIRGIHTCIGSEKDSVNISDSFGRTTSNLQHSFEANSFDIDTLYSFSGTLFSTLKSFGRDLGHAKTASLAATSLFKRQKTQSGMVQTSRAWMVRCVTVYGQQLPASSFGLVDLVSLGYNDDARFYTALFSDLEQIHCA